MTTVLASRTRRAAHGLHRCGHCGKKIKAHTAYLDQRLATEGTVYTFRSHAACDDLFQRAARYFDLEEDESAATYTESVHEYQREHGLPVTGWPEAET
jgi:hypothetical protein